MAVIGKIREKSSLLLIIIGVAMLAFILGDMFRSGQSFFGESNNIGEIGDVQISGIEFNNRLEQSVARWESQNKQAANQQIRESLREQVWNEIVREQVVGSQINTLGINVSPEELFDMIQGNDPHPQVKQAFSNPQTGEFNSSQVLQYLKSLETMPAENKAQWLLFEEGIQKERVYSKYFNLIKKGMHAPTAFSKRMHNEQGEKKMIKFVAQRYFTVQDSAISVSEEEIKAYYEEHKHEYTQDATREIEYVKFDVNPSEVDIAETKKWAEETYTEFKASGNDSAYVTFNSDLPFDVNYYSEANMPFVNDSNFFNVEVGTTVGPYEEGNAYVIAKLSNVKMVPDSVNARHILLKATNQPTDTLLKPRMDSIKDVIENGGNFAEIAKELSEDVGSAIKGGDLGWFKEGQMVPQFNDACFNGKSGDLTIVFTQYGVHLIEIMDQGPLVRKVQVGKIVRNIEPSNETYDAAFAQASTFYSENNNSEAFTKAMEEGSLLKRMAEVKFSDKTIAGLEEPREMIRWAFNNEKGSISAPFQFGKAFVVAHLANVKTDGTAKLEDVRAQVEIGAKKKKKAAMFIEEMKGAGNLDELAAKIEGGKVESAKDVSFASYSIPGMGQEPAIIGAIASLAKGQISEPIEGKTGVFVVMVEDVTAATETEDYSSYKLQQEQLLQNNANRTLEMLKDKFGITDNRHKYY